MQAFESKNNEAAAEVAPFYDSKDYLDVPGGVASQRRPSLSEETLPANTPLTISKTGLSHNLVIESPSGPLFYATIHSNFATPENPNIKISHGGKKSSTMVATAEFDPRSSEVVVRLPGDPDSAPIAMQAGGKDGRSFLFPMELNGRYEAMEWKPMRNITTVEAWTCLRAETGEVVMEYQKAKRGFGRKMGEAKWTPLAAEIGIAEGPKGMIVFAGLVVVLEEERRSEGRAAASNFEKQRVETAMWTHAGSNAF